MEQFVRRPAVRLTILALSGVVNWYIFIWFFQWLGVPDAHFIASALLISVLVHELGHAYAMRRSGIQSVVVFFVIAGGTVPLDIEKQEKLRDGKKAGIFLAGMFGNVLVGCVAVVLESYGYLSRSHLDLVLNMNAGLILFNMIPIAGFDGSRFVRLLFHSVLKEWDTVLFQITAVPVAMAMMVLLYMRGDIPIAMPLILLELFFKSRNHDTNVRGTMHRDEQVYWAVVYALLVVVSVIVFNHTSTWSRV